MFRFAMFHLGLLIFLVIPYLNLFMIFVFIPYIIWTAYKLSNQNNISFWSAYKIACIENVEIDNAKNHSQITKNLAQVANLIKKIKLNAKWRKALKILVILATLGILFMISPMIIAGILFIVGFLIYIGLIAGLFMAIASFIKLN